MITVTEKAKSKAIELMANENRPADSFIRVGVEGGGLEAEKRLLDLPWSEAGGGAQRLVDEDMFPNEKQSEKKRAHGQQAEREEEQNAGEFAHEVFVARNGLGQDGVNGAVFQITRDELSRCHDCEKRAEDAHRA